MTRPVESTIRRAKADVLAHELARVGGTLRLTGAAYRDLARRCGLNRAEVARASDDLHAAGRAVVSACGFVVRVVLRDRP